MHLKACAAMSKLPYDLWFKKCFAGCLPESSLQRQDFFFPLSVFNSIVILNRCYHMDFYLLRSYEGSFIADLDMTLFCFILLVTDTR